MNLKKLLSTFLWVLILVISVPCLAYEGLTVKIGYAQGLELYHQSSILKETLEYLQKKIPNYRFELLPISSVDTQEDIKKEKIDFLIAPSNFFVELNDNKSFILLVENSGNLMTDKDLSRLVSLGESVKPDGLGLGLSIIRGIADLHGADLGFTGRDKGGVIASLRIDQLHV